MKEPPSQSEALTPEESIEFTLEMLMTTAPIQRRSPEVRAEQQRKDRERMRVRPVRVSRGRDRHVRTISLPRTRSREQSHAPRSTPKAAKRSGASGDSSDPPGSSPAALAALLLFLLREMSS
jgi:hypothetical protein